MSGFRGLRLGGMNLGTGVYLEPSTEAHKRIPTENTAAFAGLRLLCPSPFGLGLRFRLHVGCVGVQALA